MSLRLLESGLRTFAPARDSSGLLSDGSEISGRGTSRRSWPAVQRRVSWATQVGWGRVKRTF